MAGRARKPADPLEHDLITVAGLLFEAESALERRLAARSRARAGLPLATFEVLIRLARSPGRRIRLTDLGRQLAITTGGTTRMIDRLEHEDLVRRVRDGEDRRTVFAEITPRGLELLEREVGPHIDDLEEAIQSRLSAGDLAALERGTRALRDALSDG